MSDGSIKLFRAASTVKRNITCVWQAFYLKSRFAILFSIVMTKQLKKSVYHKTRFLTKLVQNNLNHSNLLQNNRNGQNAQKLKIDQKR